MISNNILHREYHIDNDLQIILLIISNKINPKII